MKGRPQAAIRAPNGWLRGPLDDPAKLNNSSSGAPEQGVRVASGSLFLASGRAILPAAANAKLSNLIHGRESITDKSVR